MRSSPGLSNRRLAAHVGPILAACLLLGLCALAPHVHDSYGSGQHCRLCDVGAAVPAPVPAEGFARALLEDAAPAVAAEPATPAFDPARASHRRAPPSAASIRS